MGDEKPQNVNPHLIVPVGTHVVTLVEVREMNGQASRRSGAVGKVTRSPTDNTHSYDIHFPDGGHVSLHRQEFAIRKHLQNPLFECPTTNLSDRNLFDSIIYRCTVGSRAYGLDVSSSDTDTRGIFLPPASLHWSLYGVPEQIENTDNEECYWEMQKFIILSLKANPNVLECLYTPLVVHATELASELLQNRHRFLSQLAYQTYNGYVMSQFRKLEQDLRTRGDLKWKHVMHLIRLLLSGITILKDGYVPVDVGDKRESLMSIRRGERTWEEINEWRLQLHKEFDAASASSSLPERPDYEWANSFLIKSRRHMVN
jgi:predicted nucleotidyltransferase